MTNISFTDWLKLPYVKMLIAALALAVLFLVNAVVWQNKDGNKVKDRELNNCLSGYEKLKNQYDSLNRDYTIYLKDNIKKKIEKKDSLTTNNN